MVSENIQRYQENAKTRQYPENGIGMRRINDKIEKIGSRNKENNQ